MRIKLRYPFFLILLLIIGLFLWRGWSHRQEDTLNSPTEEQEIVVNGNETDTASDPDSETSSNDVKEPDEKDETGQDNTFTQTPADGDDEAAGVNTGVTNVNSGVLNPNQVPLTSLPADEEEEKPLTAADLVGETYFTVVANVAYPLPEGFVPPDLIDIGNGKSLNATAYSHLKDMFADMKKAGLKVTVASGYRSYTKQKSLFDRKIKAIQAQYPKYTKQQVYDKAATIVAIPGTSEHQTGLSVDVTKDGTLEQSFGKTKEGIWIAENCHKYGFIIRYPKNKESVTKIIYEPWHLRYVGIENAKKIHASGLSMEEYYNKLIK